MADITRLSDLESCFEGADAIVHLAGASCVDAPWEDVLSANVVGTYNVLEAARRKGVKRVVLASSSHVVGMYEVEAAPELYEPDDTRCWDEQLAPRPDSLYGVSKLFVENLGRMYVDVHGLSVVCLRIGWVLGDDDPGRVETRPLFEPLRHLSPDQVRRRMRAMYLSHRDCSQLVQRALEADVKWAVVYGTSANSRQVWDLSSARGILGYKPTDSAPT